MNYRAYFWCLCCLGLASVHASGPGSQNGYYQKAAQGILEDAFGSQVVGHGRTLEEARAIALDLALQKVRLALARHHPPLVNYQPSQEDLEKYFLKDEGRAGKDSPEATLLPKTWILTWKIPDWDLLESLDRGAARQQISQDRLWNLARFLAVLLAGLAAWTLYVCVNEWTQRHYTRWLQVGLSGLFLSIVLASWYWMQ